MKRIPLSPWPSAPRRSRALWLRVAFVFWTAGQIPTGLYAGDLTGWTGGEKSALIIPVGFTDAPAPAGPAEGWTNLVANDNAYFLRQSYSNYWIGRFDVCPAVDLGTSSTNYKPHVNWLTSAFLPDIRAKAKLAGYDSDDYDLEIIHTAISTESQAGSAATGGKGVWINMSNGSERITLVVAHELGHNLGAFHNRGFSSSSYIYPAKTGVWLADYGNPFDRMGFGMNAGSEFCAFYKNAFGWLPDDRIIDATTSGTYRIHAFDQGLAAADNHYAMKLARDEANIYWFEFRQAYTNNPWSMDGLHVLWGAEYVLSAAGAPRLLDMTPGSAGGIYPDPVWKTGGATMFDAPLLLGRTFSDANADLHVTPVRKGGTTPESLDVAVHHGPFPGNRPPAASISATTSTPQTNETVVFTATASDLDGDALAYFWEFDDPDAPAGSGIRPFGIGSPVPDSTLRTSASNAWASNGVFDVRCTVTDMKGGRATASATITAGNGSGLTISGTVRDESGNPVEGAVVNNWNLGSPAVQFGATNFVASGMTASNGQYRIRVAGNTTYKLMARHNGRLFLCNTPGGSATGAVSVTTAGVANVNFARLPTNCTIGGTVYLEGLYPAYNPAIHGAITVHDGNPAHDALVDTNGNWRMTVPEGPVTLAFTTPPGSSVRHGFLNPYEAMDNYTTLHLFLDLPGAVSSVGFGSGGGTGDDSPRTVRIPVVLALPDGYTNATWPPNIWLKGEVDARGTAQYGVDYRMRGMEVKFTNFTSVFTNFLDLDILPNGAPHSRTVVLNLVPLTSAGHMGEPSTYSYAIIPPGSDGDLDGMPDEWEWRFATNLVSMNPADDADDDGAPNLDEYIADTDPGDTHSVLELTGIQILPEGVQVDWKGGRNVRQYLECRQSVTNAADTWQILYTNLPTTSATPRHLHPDLSSPGALPHYRIRATR